MLRGDGRAALLAVAEVENRGLDTLHFSRQLLSLMRDLVVMVVTDGGEELTDLLSDEQRMASEILAGIDGLEVQRAFYALSRLVDEIGRSASPRTVLEMGLVRIATRPPLRSLAEILARLEALEAGGHRGGPRSGSAGQGGGYRGGAGAGSRAGSGSGAAAGSRAEPGGDRAPSQASSAAAQENAADRSAGGDRGASQANQRPPTPDRSTRTDEGGAADRALAPDAQQPPAEVSPAAPPPPSRVDPEGHRDEALGSDPQPAVANASREMDTGPGSALRPPGEANLGSAPPTGSADHAASIPDEGDAVLTSWQRIIDKLGDQRPALAAILEHGVPVRVDGDAVEIAFPQGSFFGRQAEADDATDALAVSAAEVMGRRPKIIIAYSTTKGEGRTVAQLQATRREDRREAIRQEALNHPRVLEAMQVFPASAGNVEVHIDGD